MFTYLLEKAWPQANFFSVPTDIRQSTPFPDGYLDTVIAMEVFEHLTDPVGHHEIHLDGVFSALHEISRILKDGGLFFLTTPNAGSLAAIQRIIDNKHPFYSPIHYREYTCSEIEQILDVYFCNIHIETFSVFEDSKFCDFVSHMDSFRRHDDIFCLCKKKKNSITNVKAHKKMFEGIFSDFFKTRPRVEEVFDLKYRR